MPLDTRGVDCIVYFCTPSRLSFSFSSPGPGRSPYCDSVIVVRFWKIAPRESVLKTGGLAVAGARLSVERRVASFYGREREADWGDRSVLIFLRLTSRHLARFFSRTGRRGMNRACSMRPFKSMDFLFQFQADLSSTEVLARLYKRRREVRGRRKSLRRRRGFLKHEEKNIHAVAKCRTNRP